MIKAFLCLLFLVFAHVEINGQTCSVGTKKEITPIPLDYSDGETESARRLEGRYRIPILQHKTVKYEPLNIKLNLDYLDSLEEVEDDVREKIVDALENTTATLSKLISVPKRMSTTLRFKTLHPFSYLQEYYGNETITFEKGINYVLYVILKEDSPGTLAGAAATNLDGKTKRPIVGIVEINSLIDFSVKNIEVQLRTTILHEITHALGFTENFLRRAKNCPEEGCIIQREVKPYLRKLFAGPKTVAMARNYFGCDKLEGVELENQGLSGTAGSHWEMRIMAGDYMVGIDYLENMISEITLAALDDLGFYKINYLTGGLFKFGKGKGCGFLTDNCEDKAGYEVKYKNEYFKTYYQRRVCLSSRTGMGATPEKDYNNFYKRLKKDLDDIDRLEFAKLADYCPIASSIDMSSADHNIYNCNYGDQKKMNLNYRIDGVDYPKNTLKSVVSDHSFCALSSVIEGGKGTIKEFQKQNLLSYFKYRPVCLEMFCSPTSLTILAKDYYLVCPRQGGKIKYDDDHDGDIACPDYNLICSGTEVCNDLYDCINKESTYKEEAFDYGVEIIKTSQDPKDLDMQQIAEAYELSDEGICPKYCQKCDLDGTCVVCGKGYQLDEEMRCVKSAEKKGKKKKKKIPLKFVGRHDD